MTEMVPFTSNYTDQSTREGYQFEFNCLRCGNGYSSTFQHSVTGFGGRLLQMGGDLLGGPVGDRAAQLGFDAEWLRDGNRGSTRDRALTRAVAEMSVHFVQCHRCGQWVCRALCWNATVGLCATCAPNLDQEIAGMRAAANVNQLNEQLQQVDWTAGSGSAALLPVRCPSCAQDSGGGRFCQHCGTALTARACRQCGTPLGALATFCTGCGTPAGA